MGITQIAAWATKTTHLIALYFVVLMYSIFLTIFFNVDRADQLDCRRWRDNIKKAVRDTAPPGDARRDHLQQNTNALRAWTNDLIIMFKMNLNPIFRCDKNGLWPLNAISLARVSTHLSAKEYLSSLVGKSQDWNLVKHRHGSFGEWMNTKIDAEHKSTNLEIHFEDMVD